MKELKLSALLVFLCFLLLENTFAYNLRQISKKDGLSNSAILTINQDREGFMWFGTCDGLNMFDGSGTRVFKPLDGKNNLSGNLVFDILETENGRFWVYTNYGLDRLDKKKRTIDHFKEFGGALQLRKSKDNDVFVIKENGAISYFHKTKRAFQKIALPDLVFKNTINYNIDDHNILWLFSKDGKYRLYRIEKKEDGTIRLKWLRTVVQTHRTIYCFNEKNAVYLVDDTYTLYEFNLLTGKKHYIHRLKDEVQRRGGISSIIRHHSDYFIGFNTNGLIELKNQSDQVEQYRIEEIDIKSGVLCLYKDKKQDIVWVGTDGQGVFLIFNDVYSIRSNTFNNAHYKVEKPIRAIFLDAENTLWLGTKGDGIVKLKNFDFNQTNANDLLEQVTTDNSALRDNSVYAFARSKRNLLWIGNDVGLDYYSYNDRVVKPVPVRSGETNLRYVHSIYEASDSVLWISSVGMGLFRAKIGGSDQEPYLYDVKHFSFFDRTMSSNYFFAIDRDQKSTLWFGNRGRGLIKLESRSQNFKSILFDTSGKRQALNDVFSVYHDKTGSVWCGTSMGLVKLMPNHSIQIFNERNGFPNSTVHGILKDSRNNLWLSTNLGLIKFDSDKESFQTYDQRNGLTITEFSDGAYFKSEEKNLIFFGGINGFVTIKESKIAQQEYQPPIYFDKLTLFGQDRNIYDYLSTRKEKQLLTLNHNQNFFSLSFTANDYINGNNYAYFYKLDKVNENWTDNGTSNVVSFTNIAPGKYTLLVKYKNRTSGKMSRDYSIVIRIRPAWYVSTIAYILYFLLFVTGLSWAVRYLYNQNKKKRRLMMHKLEQDHQQEVYESKLRFFTNIAHEFCTPLTLIYGPCNRILSYKKTDEFVKKYTLLIQRNADRLNDLIQELIEFRRIETDNRQPQVEELRVDEVAGNVVDSFVDLAEQRSISYNVDIQSPLVWNTDKGFLTIVMNNLISNAFKYVKSKGNIRVVVKLEGDYLRMEVSNTGKGIRKEEMEQIFDRYTILDNFENQEEKAPTSRNGLGMAITYSLVKLLNGTIDIRSIPDKWTDFIVQIPRSEVSQHPVYSQKALPDVKEQRKFDPIVKLPNYEYNDLKRTILVVDDDIEMLWFICETFAADYNIVPVNKAVETERILESNHPDVILCDIMMPHMDGIELTRRIKANPKTAHIPMILVTAKQEVQEKIEGLSAGAEMYITKPFNVDYLKTSVEHLLHRNEALKTYFTSPISAFELTNGQMTHKENKKFIQHIYDIINSNLMNKDLSAKFIAMELNISARHLYRRLESLNVKSPQKMISDSRLYVARNLLITSKMTIDEIIFKSGFSNRSSFFKAFSEKYQCTPKEFRDKKMDSVTEE